MIITASTLVITIIIFLVLWWITKKILKAVIFSMIITLVGLGVFGYLIFSDIMEMKEKFTEEPKLLLLVDEEDVIAGIEVEKLEFEEEDEQPFDIIEKEQLENYEELYEQGREDEILENRYKIIYLEMNVIEEGYEPAEDDEEGLRIEKDELIEMLNSESAHDLYIEKAFENIEFPEGIPEEQQNIMKEQMEEDLKKENEFLQESESTKSFLMLQAIATSAVKKGPIFMIKKFKEGEIRLYPETITFKLIRETPVDIAKEFLDEKVEEVTEG